MGKKKTCKQPLAHAFLLTVLEREREKKDRCLNNSTTSLVHATWKLGGNQSDQKLVHNLLNDTLWNVN